MPGKGRPVGRGARNPLLQTARAALRDAPPRVRRAVALGGLLLLVAGTFSAGLGAGFVFDDRRDVIANAAATPAGFAAALGTTNRPLLKATYAAQRALFGAGAFSFHAVNLALHLGTTLVVFGFLRSVLLRRALPAVDAAAAFGTAAWALHPAAAETVVPVVGRSVGLSSLLLLAALSLATGGRPRRTAAFAAGALAFAAPLVRETALVLPLLGLLWQGTLGAGEPRGTALRRQLPLAIGAGLSAAALALSDRHRELVSYSLATRPPLEALRGNVNAVFDILGMWVVPGRVSIDPPPSPELPWTSWTTLLHAALLAAAVLAAWRLRRQAPAAAFACGLSLLTLAPTNSVIWRIDPVGVRPLYLASIGPALLAAAAIAHLSPLLARLPRPWRIAGPRIGVTLGAAALAAIASAGASRAALYADPVALWSDAAGKAPLRSRPLVNLGVQLLIRDQLDPAEDAFRKALALEPENRNARCALDAILVRRLAANLQHKE